MIARTATRPVSFTELVHDPLFSVGYEEIWRGDAIAFDRKWLVAERSSYLRGRLFGVFVKNFDGCRVPLVAAGNIHHRTLVLLSLAGRLGALT